MNTEITYAVGCTVISTNKSDVQDDLAAIPTDFTLPNFWGLLLVSDATTNPSGNALQRTWVFKMVPTIGDATITAQLQGGSAAAPVAKLTVTGAGGLYARPPILTFTGGGTPLAQAIAYAQMQVGGALVLQGGAAYTGATIATFVGGDLAPGGTPAVAGAVTVVGNAVTGVAVATPGGPYNVPPTCVISDTGGGAGAEVVLGLSVSGATLAYGGKGYTSAPTVVVTPLCKAMAPDSSNQASLIIGFMVGICQNVLKMPCVDIAAAS